MAVESDAYFLCPSRWLTGASPAIPPFMHLFAAVIGSDDALVPLVAVH